MADPPEVYATAPTRTAAELQLNTVSVGIEDANNTNIDIVATQSNATPVLHTNASIAEHTLVAAVNGEEAAASAVNNITPARKSDVATHHSSAVTTTRQQSGVESEEHAAVSADSNPSLSAKLPGELRNRISRAFFEDSHEQKKSTLDIKKTAPSYLKLLHIDRMIRSGASSIFYKEHFWVDDFIALTPDLESGMESRMESICELVALRDIHMPISITVQEMVLLQMKMLRQMPCTWISSRLCTLLHPLTAGTVQSQDDQSPC